MKRKRKRLLIHLLMIVKLMIHLKIRKFLSKILSMKLLILQQKTANKLRQRMLNRIL